MYSRLSAEMVVVVQHQDELLFDSLQHLVEKNVDGAFGMLREFAGSFLEIRKESFAKAGHLLPNTEGEVAKKHRRIRIRVVKLVPDKFSLVSSQEVRDQGGLSGAGIGRDHGQGIAEICQQTIRKSRTG